MARHKEKDDEAGGEGLGILATRKRLWRDSDGNIVNARRPSYVQDGTKRRQLTRPDRKSSSASDSSSQIPMSRTGSTASSTIIVDTGSEVSSPGYASPISLSKPDPSSQPQDSWLTLAALPSPPVSSSEDSPSDDASELDALYEDTWPLTHNGLPEIINDSPILGRTSEYPASPSWGPQPFQTFMGAQGLYEDVFKSEVEGGMGGYEWLSGGQWSGMQAMSRCREEKFDPLLFESERKRDWSGTGAYLEGGFRRGFGLGTA
ncbi:hypothetical protein L207DRAFT_340334 [Hyaloscypha variabilis F]|uniref:Uncharacterized protein n=1 Tax=Hyaloscypha variabilis (strain UAMH 11265 / GT02V1 / F) TaxID=1149755 RepID=A0A2J6RPT1_HYAVF|nr:hypothetical protein L207DRAFT_340334 [Hyaloscypha variabilis F]